LSAGSVAKALSERKVHNLSVDGLSGDKQRDFGAAAYGDVRRVDMCARYPITRSISRSLNGKQRNRLGGVRVGDEIERQLRGEPVECDHFDDAIRRRIEPDQ
jgi:hypothetical protein